MKEDGSDTAATDDDSELEAEVAVGDCSGAEVTVGGKRRDMGCMPVEGSNATVRLPTAEGGEDDDDEEEGEGERRAADDREVEDDEEGKGEDEEAEEAGDSPGK